MHLSVNASNSMLTSLSNLFSANLLTMYSGVMPATPSTALSNNTALVSYTFTYNAFSAPTNSAGTTTIAVSLSNATQTPIANGQVTFARATMVPLTWTIGTPYFIQQIVNVNGNFYICIVSGTSHGTGGTGPSGTGGTIVDGTVVWSYISANTGQNNVLADFTVGTSNADIIIANTSLSTLVPVTITSLSIQLPAS